MSLHVPDNIREPWSSITDTSILRPGDELKLIGRRIIAEVAVLDSHDPSAGVSPELSEVLSFLGTVPLRDHYHLLVRPEGDSEVLSTGLYVAQGLPDELLFGHITQMQKAEDTYRDRLRRLHEAIGLGVHGLYFMSDQEQLSTAPGAQQFLDPQGGLLR